MKKRVLSSILAACIAASMTAAVNAAPGYYVQDFSGASTGGNGGYSWLANYQIGTMNWTTSSGWSGAFNKDGENRYNFQIADGILGKTSGDKSWKWSLQRNAGAKGIRLNETSNTTDGETFYIQSSVYLNEFDSPNTFRMGGESYLGNARKTAYLEFASDGRIYQNNSNVTDEMVVIDKYEPNNWYTVTMAFYANDGKTNVAKFYLDGKEIAQYSYDGSMGEDEIKNAYMINAWQYEIQKGEAYSQTPFWAVLDDFKVVQGAFEPSDANTDISSESYEILNPTYQKSGSQSMAKISGIPSNISVAALKDNIIAPKGGEIRIVRINPQSDKSLPFLRDNDLKTVVADNSDIVTSEHKLVSVSAGGAVKIYDLEVEEPSEYEAKVTSSQYDVNNDEMIVSGVAKFTKIEKFLKNITPSYGASLKVKNIFDDEVSNGYINENLIIEVTSKDGKTNEYSISVDKTLISDYRGSGSYLNDQPLGLMQKLIGYSEKEIDGVKYFGAASSRYTRIAGLYGGVRSNFPRDNETSELTYSKVADKDGAWGYEFVNPTTATVFRKISDRTLAAYNENKGSDIVLEYSIQPMTAGRYVMALDILAADANGNVVTVYPQDITNRATPNISFQTDNGVNNIRFGVREYADGWNSIIGTWTPGEKYNVVLAVKKLDKDSDAYYIKGIWINGKEIEKTTLGNGSQAGDYWKLNNSANGQTKYAPYTPKSISDDVNRNAHEGWTWNTAAFSAASADGNTPGQVNYSNIRIYTADGYEPEQALTISSSTLEVYEYDKILKRPTIKGFSGTAADLKSALIIPEGVITAIYDKDVLIGDSDEIRGGMILRLFTKDCSASRDYFLSDTIDMGKYELYDSTGFIPVESITQTDGGLVIQKTVKKYNMEDITEFVLAAAVYRSSDNKLLALQTVNQDSYNDVDGLMLEMDLSGYNTEEIYVKTFFIDSFANMKPYCGSLILAEDIKDESPSPTNQQ